MIKFEREDSQVYAQSYPIRQDGADSVCVVGSDNDDKVEVVAQPKFRKNRLYGTIQAFMDAHTEHQLEWLQPLDFKNLRVPIWCGICKKPIQGQDKTNSKDLQVHCGRWCHVSKLPAQGTEIAPDVASQGILAKSATCQGYSTASVTVETYAMKEFKKSVRTRGFQSGCLAAANSTQHAGIS